jgi:hypothetical protein
MQMLAIHVFRDTPIVYCDRKVEGLCPIQICAQLCTLSHAVIVTSIVCEIGHRHANETQSVFTYPKLH